MAKCRASCDPMRVQSSGVCVTDMPVTVSFFAAQPNNEQRNRWQKDVCQLHAAKECVRVCVWRVCLSV